MTALALASSIENIESWNGHLQEDKTGGCIGPTLARGLQAYEQPIVDDTHMAFLSDLIKSRRSAKACHPSVTSPSYGPDGETMQPDACFANFASTYFSGFQFVFTAPYVNMTIFLQPT